MRISVLTGGLLLGLIVSTAQAASFSGNVMWTYQQSDRAGVVPETTLSSDLFADGTFKQIGWGVHVEGNTTPDARGPSALGAQAAAGVAMDTKGNGRMQVSEAFLSTPLLGGTLYGGLLDLTGFADTSDVANDETTQFLNNDLTNNTTIAFPDYDLSLVWSSERLTLILGNNAGLADSNGNYQALFKMSELRSGTFFLAETTVDTPLKPVRAGVWKRDLPDNGKTSWGAYLNTDQSLGGWDWNLRLGWAEESAQDAARFISVAGQKSWQRWTLGLGHATTVGSAPRRASDRQVSETYLRYTLNHHWHLSGDVQRIEQEKTTWVAGLRLLWQF